MTTILTPAAGAKAVPKASVSQPKAPVAPQPPKEPTIEEKLLAALLPVENYTAPTKELAASKGGLYAEVIALAEKLPIGRKIAVKTLMELVAPKVTSGDFGRMAKEALTAWLTGVNPKTQKPYSQSGRSAASTLKAQLAKFGKAANFVIEVNHSEKDASNVLTLMRVEPPAQPEAEAPAVEPSA